VRIVILSLEFLLFLFTFVDNKFNRASIPKRSKKGTKEENKATGRLVAKGGTTAVGQPCSRGQGVRMASLS